MLNSPIRVALVGGGRWARTHATVLSRILPHGSEVLWISRHNHEEISHFVRVHTTDNARFTILKDRHEAFRQNPEAALVVTAPYRHFDDAMFALEQGVSTLVEKPLALDEIQALQLIETAKANNLVLSVGLTMMLTTYVPYLANKIACRVIKQLHLRWIDPPFEVRHGEEKIADLTVHKVHDILPHLWSILKVIRPHGEFEPFHVFPGAAGEVSAISRWAGAPVRLSFGRRGAHRERLVELDFEDGGSARLNFASEPGTLVIDQTQQPFDPNWERCPRPLPAEQSGFFRAVRERESNWCLAAHLCLGSVTSAVALQKIVQAAEAAALARCLEQNNAGNPNTDAWLLDNLGPELAGERRVSFFDDSSIASIVCEGMEALRSAATSRWGISPFIAQVRQHLAHSAR
jgi:predicted dehydrogenase